MSIVETILVLEVAILFDGAALALGYFNGLPFIGAPIAVIGNAAIGFIGGLTFSFWLLFTGKIKGWISGFIQLVAVFAPGGKLAVVFYQAILPKLPVVGEAFAFLLKKGGAAVENVAARKNAEDSEPQTREKPHDEKSETEQPRHITRMPESFGAQTKI